MKSSMCLPWARKILCIALLSYCSYNSYASHIVGGEIIYTYLSHSADSTSIQYHITLNLYRDPEGINYDQQASFGIYRQNASGQWDVHDVVRDVPIGPVIEIDPHTDPCRTLFINSTKLESTTYSFTIDLEVSDFSYMISYQKCCRNFTINNIDYESVGAVYDILITPEAQRLKNSSPSFTEIPPHFICQGYDIDIRNKGVDMDGDSLVYSFCNPIFPAIHADSPPGCCGCTTPDPGICPPEYLELEFVAPYSSDNPLGGAPQITIQSDNGQLTGVPTTLGSYVLAICIEEYRDGELLSTVRRDFEFNVIPCTQRLIAAVESDSVYLDPTTGEEVAYFESCDITAFDIINQSIDETYIRNYRWDIYDSNGDQVLADNGLDLRDHTIPITDRGVYYGEMIVNDDGACSDTAYLQFYIPEEIELDFDFSYDPCIAGPVQFENKSTPLQDLEFSWDFGDSNESEEVNPSHAYDIRGFYNVVLAARNDIQCTETLTKTIEWNPYYLTAPDTIISDTLLCYHDSIYINANWVYSAGTYFDYIPSEVTGCDSIVIAHHVDFTPYIFPNVETVNICEGEFYQFQSSRLEESGLYYDTLRSHQNCDSIVGVNLSVNQLSFYEYEETLCFGDSLIFGSLLISESGQYYDTLLNQNLCDSIVLIVVEVLQKKQSYSTATICDNETYTFNGDLIQETGEYHYELLTEDGCDSISSLSLIVNETSETFLFDTICKGDVYVFGDEMLSLAGRYTRRLTNQFGCDSTITVELFTAQNLSRIDLENELEEEYGTTVTLAPEIIGPDLIYQAWYETDEILSNSLQLEYTVSDDNWIYFESTNIYFCIARDSVFVKSRIDKDIYIPNIFTPDGDDFNDTFYLGASPTLAASKMYVYDRWGNKMYEGDKVIDHSVIRGWDGQYHGKPAEPGTYTYVFDLIYINGDYEKVAGSFHLIR